METIIQVQPDYLDENFIRTQDQCLYRFDSRDGRNYFDIDQENNLNIYPSTTTVIGRFHPTGVFLKQWMVDSFASWKDYQAFMFDVSNYGTFMHIVLKDIVLGHDVDISDLGLMVRISDYLLSNDIDPARINRDEWIKKAKQDAIGIVQWIQDYEFIPIAVEMTIASRDMRYAGTIDLVGIITDKEKKYRVMIDYKTGRTGFFDEYPIQLEGYRRLWDEKYPEARIERTYNLGAKDYRLPIGKTVTPYRFQRQDEDTILTGKWTIYLTMFQMEYDSFMPKPRTEIKDCIINNKTKVNEVIEMVDPIERMKLTNGMEAPNENQAGE